MFERLVEETANRVVALEHLAQAKRRLSELLDGCASDGARRVVMSLLIELDIASSEYVDKHTFALESMLNDDSDDMIEKAIGDDNDVIEVTTGLAEMQAFAKRLKYRAKRGRGRVTLKTAREMAADHFGELDDSEWVNTLRAGEQLSLWHYTHVYIMPH